LKQPPQIRTSTVPPKTPAQVANSRAAMQAALSKAEPVTPAARDTPAQPGITSARTPNLPT
jgi:hypothetical protein